MPIMGATRRSIEESAQASKYSWLPDGSSVSSKGSPKHDKRNRLRDKQLKFGQEVLLEKKKIEQAKEMEMRDLISKGFFQTQKIEK